MILQYQSGNRSPHLEVTWKASLRVLASKPLHFLCLILVSFFPALLIQGSLALPKLLYSKSILVHQSSLLANPDYCSSPYLLKNNLSAAELHLRNEAMLCICLADLLSPFLLFQLLSQLSSLLHSPAACATHLRCFSIWFGVAELPPLFLTSSGGDNSSANVGPQLVGMTGSRICSPERVRSFWISNVPSLECSVLMGWWPGTTALSQVGL